MVFDQVSTVVESAKLYVCDVKFDIPVQLLESPLPSPRSYVPTQLLQTTSSLVGVDDTCLNDKIEVQSPEVKTPESAIKPDEHLVKISSVSSPEIDQ